ncbi:uncharacterized protein BDV17DRAFT_295592 [Aspergillus undulatus]|uniref:uncharacterized protein n=1 Tax=Aspergillus undulatus TaxID=1810928 RepID=UPI003CCE0DDC
MEPYRTGSNPKAAPRLVLKAGSSKSTMSKNTPPHAAASSGPPTTAADLAASVSAAQPGFSQLVQTTASSLANPVYGQSAATIGVVSNPTTPALTAGFSRSQQEHAQQRRILKHKIRGFGLDAQYEEDAAKRQKIQAYLEHAIEELAVMDEHYELYGRPT